MVLVERLEDGGAAEGVAGEEHVVHVDPTAEGGQVELILMLAEGGLLSRVCLLNPGYPIKYQVTLVYPILPLPPSLPRDRWVWQCLTNGRRRPTASSV